MRAVGEPRPEALERALASEYATLYAQRDLDQAPLLRRVVEQHGVAALPEAMRAASGGGSMAAFVVEWVLGVQPGSEPGYSAVLWELAREASCCGQAPTCELFLALALHDHDTQWVLQPAQHPSCPTGSVWPGATAPPPVASR
jgi:hypothetical protein